MIQTKSSGIFVLLLSLFLLALAGCAAKVPETTPLAAEQQQEAEALLRAFLQAARPTALDADIRLGWAILGSKGGIDATLQLQQPAFLRFSATDPLGRPIFLAVSDGTSFTLVDNRIGRIYQGKTDSKFWHAYVPAPLLPEDLFFFLSGSIRSLDMQTLKKTQNREKTGFWYVWKDKRSMTHHVLLDWRNKEMLRHLLLDAHENMILDMTYSAYSGPLGTGFNWPRHLQIKGTAITGTLTVQVEKIYSHVQQTPATFHLIPPPHFTLEQVR